MKPLVSILVPTYNRPGLLQRTLQSLFAQTYDNLEIVVVNDGGQNVNNVIDIFEEKENVALKYINKETNDGLAATRNVAIQSCHGEYITLLDDDDIFLPLTIEFRMWQIQKQNVDIVYTRALQDIWDPNPNGQGYVSVHKQLYWDSPFNKDLILVQNIAPCNCVTFSRRAWDKADNYLFDSTLTTGEDQDFWTALSRKTDFTELKLVDCEDSHRRDNTQMTGSRDFGINTAKIYQKWRHTAIDKEWVVNAQNQILISRGINPQDYGL